MLVTRYQCGICAKSSYIDKEASPNAFVTSRTTQLDCAYARVAATR
jgi:hypothetical protein